MSNARKPEDTEPNVINLLNADMLVFSFVVIPRNPILAQAINDLASAEEQEYWGPERHHRRRKGRPTCMYEKHRP